MGQDGQEDGDHAAQHDAESAELHVHSNNFSDESPMKEAHAMPVQRGEDAQLTDEPLPYAHTSCVHGCAI
jgi:hypothetical protein